MTSPSLLQVPSLFSPSTSLSDTLDTRYIDNFPCDTSVEFVLVFSRPVLSIDDLTYSKNAHQKLNIIFIINLSLVL